MTIWGKIIGGVAGYILGGPLGAMAGAAFGHAIDRSAQHGKTKFSNTAIEARQTAFSIAVIVLSAKMAKADGTVTRDEINTFKRIFRIPSDEIGDVGRLFDEARKDAEGYEPYAKQIGKMFRHDPNVLENLLSGLYQIALADGVIHPKEKIFLEKVARALGFSKITFNRIHAANSGGKYSDPYEILGVKVDDTDQTIKKVYRKLIRENHPDLLVAKGMPQDFMDLANKRMSDINIAYEKIQKLRSL